MKKVIKFGASWCSPCRAMESVIRKVSGEYPQIQFEDIDVDDNPDIVEKYSIKNVPTVIVVDGSGNVLKRHSGTMTYNTMKKMIEES